MSFPLPDLDVSSAVAGSQFSISLANTGIGAGAVSANPAFINRPAQIYIFNDSGAGFTAIYDSGGGGFQLPAGAWTIVPLPAGESQINLSTKYVLPNAPVSTVLSTYYAPGEATPPVATLGNSPIGGAVTSTIAQQIQNTNQPPANTIIFAKPTGDTSVAGATNFNNQGQGILGDATYAGSLDINGTISATNYSNTITPNELQMSNGLVNVLDIYSGTPTVINGSVSGTVTIYEWMKGSLKALLVIFNNYRTASSNNYTLLSAYQSFAAVRAGGIAAGSTTDGGVSLLHSGGTINVFCATTLGSSSSGSASAETVVRAYTYGEAVAAWDTLQILSNTASHSGVLEIIGN